MRSTPKLKIKMSNMIKIRNFSGGLNIGAPEDEIPQGALVCARGIHPISQRSARSRFGGSLLHSVGAHTIFRYKDAWYYGVSTAFYAGSVSIKSALGGSRLASAKMGPTAGVDDRLFVAGGEELFKVDISTSIVNASYKWTASTGAGTDDYYLTTAGGDDPGLDEPDTLLVDNEAATEGTISTLAAGEWVYGDDATDALGYDTIYIRLSDGTDPDSKADDYIKALYVQNWGIVSPQDTAIAADGGAGGNLDDGAVYSYRFTFYNSKIGVRSNPTSVFTTDGDAYTKLLLHCEGADASTTFTDDSPVGHTVTEAGNAQIDTAQKKFGSASGLFDGTGDSLSVASHPDWNFGSEEFTYETFQRFAALPSTPNSMPYFSRYVDADNNIYFSITNLAGTYYLIFTVYSGGVQVISNIVVWAGVVINTWYHVALIRGWAGSVDKFAITVDGVALITWDDSSAIPDFATALQLGSDIAGPLVGEFNGWLDETRISKGIARWTENFTPPTSAYGSGTSSAAIDLNGGSTSIDLTNIPQPSDDQVDQVELWRTSGGGSTHFLLTRLAVGVTTYTDDISDDDLQSIEVPTNNLKPYPWFDDCYGPHNASMFWITRTQVGEKGRLYYSSIGRAENIEGFINVTSDADPLQKIFGWRGYLAVLSQSGIHQILGTNPYQAKAVAGAPGTNAPHTAIVTTLGLIYAANDGVRLFDGASSRLLNFDAMSKIFRGIGAAGLSSFNPNVAAYARGEYVVADSISTQTLALRLEDLRWRDVGVNCGALAYADDDDILAASISGKVLDFEKEGTTQDNTTNISFILEPKYERLSEDKKMIVQNIHIDAIANSETVTVGLVADGSVISLGTLATGASRQVTTLPAGTLARVVGVRVVGSLDDDIEIFGIDIEV